VSFFPKSGNLDGRHPTVVGKEVRRLTAVELAGLDAVVGADRDVERFLEISIEVADEKAIGPIRVLEPALVGRGHVLTRVPSGLEGKLQKSPERQKDGRHHGFCWSVAGWPSFAFFNSTSAW
jgi:hypothetical protein